MPMQSACIQFSHKSHKTAESMSLISFIHILQGCSEKGIFFCWYGWQILANLTYLVTYENAYTASTGM